MRRARLQALLPARVRVGHGHTTAENAYAGRRGRGPAVWQRSATRRSAVAAPRRGRPRGRRCRARSARAVSGGGHGERGRNRGQPAAVTSRASQGGVSMAAVLATQTASRRGEPRRRRRVAEAAARPRAARRARREARRGRTTTRRVSGRSGGSSRLAPAPDEYVDSRSPSAFQPSSSRTRTAGSSASPAGPGRGGAAAAPATTAPGGERGGHSPGARNGQRRHARADERQKPPVELRNPAHDQVAPEDTPLRRRGKSSVTISTLGRRMAMCEWWFGSTRPSTTTAVSAESAATEPAAFVAVT